MNLRPSAQGPKSPSGPVDTSRTGDAAPKAPPPVNSFLPLVQGLSFRECLIQLFGHEFRTGNIDPLAEGAIDQVTEFAPSVTLIEQTFRQLGEQIRSKIQTKMIVCAPVASPDLVYDCAVLGSEGCILQSSSPLEDLRRAMKVVLEGGMSYPPSMTRAMLEELAANREHRTHIAAKECPLTSRELQVVKLLAENPNLANKQLAPRLDISINTVKNHLHAAMEKTGQPDRRALIEYAKECGWIGSC